MSTFVEIDHIDRIFDLPNGGQYVALRNIELKIKQGEFISLIGHSGCGKSTLLNMVAGLDKPTHGGVILEGRQITSPGPDRMVVFQNYSLLPWMTVRENIALAVDEVLQNQPKGERKGIIEHHIDLVGLRHAADKKPGELSGGMKQRVAIARALAIRPKVLLLDEPFGALDALTRGGLQEQLMQIAQENHLTCIMVTHDVDEALLLSDRIVMLTNGPESHIGQILDVKIPRPRQRMEVVNHPDYYHKRNDIIYFLNQQKRDKKRKAAKGKVQTIVPKISTTILEKTTINLGFLPLTDAAPLIVAKEKGLFEKHGFKQVNLCQETNWKSIASSIENDRLDAAQMAAGLPLAMTVGMGNKIPIPMIIGMILSRNGNAITLSNKFAKQGVKTLTDLRKVIKESQDKIYSFGVVHPASMHNLMLRYWLASGGIDPDEDVNLVVLPPSEMIENLREEKIDGYCVGAPWNTPAIKENLGYVIATDLDIWPGNPEKVLGVKESWANENPLTHIALIKALLEACEYCDDQRNREEILKLISQPQYIGLSADYISNGFTAAYNRGNGEKPQLLARYNQFHFDNTNCPNRAEGLWILTQLARWGFIAFPKNWLEILERVRRVDIFGEAARQMGYPDFESDREPFTLFDGVEFNPDDPLGYLKSFEIKRKIDVKEILIDPVLAAMK